MGLNGANGGFLEGFNIATISVKNPVAGFQRCSGNQSSDIHMNVEKYI